LYKFDFILYQKKYIGITFINIYFVYSRYVHKDPEVLERSENLVSQISQVLWNLFPDVMRYLEELRSVEEIPSEQGSFASTPFTTMVTSKDIM
jgi:hypothetical protein